MGDSRAHWDGDTLVVETTNYSEKSNFMGSAENFHLVERFTRVGPDTLNWELTFRDSHPLDAPMDRADRAEEDRRSRVRVRVSRRQHRDGREFSAVTGPRRGAAQDQ